MQIIKINSFLIITLLIVSCNKNNRSGYYTDDGRTLELTFALDSVSSNYNKLLQIYEDSSSADLYVLNPYINGIDIYSLKKKRLKDRIIVSKEGPLAIKKITGFYVFSRDSIVVFSDKSLDGLFIINGSPSKRVSDYIEFENMEKYANFHIASAVPIIANNKKLFIYAMPFQSELALSAYDDLDYILDFSNKKVDRVYSELLFEDVQKWGNLRLPTRGFNPSDGTLIYSYPFLDELMIYNIESKKYSYKKLASNYFKTGTNPSSDYVNKQEFLLENNYYDALVFNNGSQRYYRFARQFVEAKTDFGKYRTSYNQPITIIVADSQLLKLDEIILSPPEKYLVKDFFITKDGIYISNANNFNENLDEDSMSFYFIKTK